MELYVKNEDGTFRHLGKEFLGFPTNGIWLVEDGQRSCIYQYKEPIPSMPTPALLSYMVLRDELVEKISKEWETKKLSVKDIAEIACEFFALKAGGMKVDDEIVEY